MDRKRHRSLSRLTVAVNADTVQFAAFVRGWLGLLAVAVGPFGAREWPFSRGAVPMAWEDSRHGELPLAAAERRSVPSSRPPFVLRSRVRRVFVSADPGYRYSVRVRA